MDHSKRYKFPPIEEAVCEFRFTTTTDWDLTVLGKLHAQLEREYTGKRHDQNVVDSNLQINEDVPENPEYEKGIAKVMLPNENGTRMVGIGPNVLSIHMLHPYHSPEVQSSGWEEFVRRIESALEAYDQVVSSVEINQVGLRYINIISVPVTSNNLGEYLICVNPRIEGLPSKYQHFLNHTRYVYDEQTRLDLSCCSLGESPTSTDCILDIDATSDHEQDPSDSRKALEIANELHRHVGLVFESTVTDKAREIFNAS